jgi:hypothetical protein
MARGNAKPGASPPPDDPPATGSGAFTAGAADG